MSSPRQNYLAELRRRLRGQPILARRIEEEISDHLAEATDAARRAGRSEDEAEAEAVRRVGPVDRYIHGFPRILWPLRLLLLLGTVALAGASLWLVYVIAVVLPLRDPGSRTLWTIVSVALGWYCLLCLQWLRGVELGSIVSRGMLVFSFASVVAGGWGIGMELQVARTGGHFEGYLLLLGLLLVFQGGVAGAHTGLSLRVARRISPRA